MHDIAESFELVQLTSKSSRTLSLSRLCSLSSFSLSISLNLYLSPPPSGSLPRLSTYTGYGESAQRVKLYGIFCRRDLPLGEDRALELDRGRKKSHKNGCLLELRWTPERPIFQRAERGCARTLVRTQSVTYPFIHTPARNADSHTPALTEWRGKIISRRSGLASEPRSLDSTTCKGETALE